MLNILLTERCCDVLILLTSKKAVRLGACLQMIPLLRTGTGDPLPPPSQAALRRVQALFGCQPPPGPSLQITGADWPLLNVVRCCRLQCRHPASSSSAEGARSS